MPQRTQHRGPASGDLKRFGRDQWPVLRTATSDLCWLLERGYAMRSAVQLVGNRYSLCQRQRLAMSRCACSPAAARRRQQHGVPPDQWRGKELWIDGFNLITTIEAASAGGVILLGCDDCYRDLASIHARYRKVAETIPALEIVGKLASKYGVAHCRWWLDRPVSNSGRLKTAMLEVAARHQWDWEVELVNNPDKVLSETDRIVVTSDSVILDRCRRWTNFMRQIIQEHLPQANVVDLRLPLEENA